MTSQTQAPKRGKSVADNLRKSTTCVHRIALTVTAALLTLQLPVYGGEAAPAAPAGGAPAAPAAYKTSVTGKGIVLPASGTIMAVNSRIDGIIRKILVKRGQKVKKDQPLAEIYNHENEKKYARTKANYEKLRDDFEKLTKQIAEEQKAQSDIAQLKLTANKLKAEQIDHKVANLQKDFETKKNLLDQGLIAPTALTAAETALDNAKLEAETIKTTIAETEFGILKGYRADEVRNKQAALDVAKEEFDFLDSQIHYYSVESPFDGEIVEILAANGQITKRGENLFILETGTDESKKVVAFLELEEGKKVHVGQPAIINFASVDQSVYGGVAGKVVEVSKYPTPGESVEKLVLNKALASALSGGKATISVTIEPNQDKSTKQFIWTKGKTPEFPVTTGTVGNVIINTAAPKK